MRRRQTLAALGAPPLQHKAAALRRHACAEAVCLCAPAIVGLESTFRHNSSNFLLQTKVLRLTSNTVCVKETEAYKDLLFDLVRFFFSPLAGIYFGNSAKSTRPETIHNFITFSENAGF
jgi:hypothetical protein